MVVEIPGCQCCGLCRTAPEMLYIAEILLSAFPDLVFTSGTRCEIHNRNEGGSPVSGHLPIWGADGGHSVAFDMQLTCWTPNHTRKLVWTAIEHGARGVGYMPHKNAVHVDRKPRPFYCALWKVEADGSVGYFF